MEARPGDRHFLRDANIVGVADTIRRHQPISRIEVAERTGLGRSTVTTIVQVLLQQGLVREVGEAESSGGRPPVLLELIDRARLLIAVRLAPRTVTMGLADLQGRIILRQRRGLRVDWNEPELLLEQVSIWAEELIKESGSVGRVLGLGVVLPGQVDPVAGVCLAAPGLGWRDVPVGPWLEQRLGLAVTVDNDANAFALGESLRGAARGHQDVLGVTLGGFMGCGLLLDGRLYRGPRASAGELGHVVVEPGGPPCFCGQQGCLEAVAGDGALVNDARALLAAGAETLMAELVEGRPGALTRDVVVAAARDGDRAAQELLVRAARRVGAVLGQLTAVISPAAVVLGGEAVEQGGRLLLEPLEAALRGYLPAWTAERVRVTPAVLGEDAWLAGAAGLVLHQVFAPPGDSPGISLVSWPPFAQ